MKTYIIVEGKSDIKQQGQAQEAWGGGGGDGNCNKGNISGERWGISK